MADEDRNEAPAAPAAPVIAAAPLTAEDPSRSAAPVGAAAARGFVGFPKLKYHPVYGAREIKDPNEEAGLQPAHNWFNSAEEADAHRTDREAQMVVHYNARVKVDGAVGGVEPMDPNNKAVTGEDGIVRNSVAATESVKAGNLEPL
jgi:hypothetical protein